MRKKTMTEVMMRLDDKDRKRILKKLRKGMGIGERVDLWVYDSFNRFELGKFEAEIKKWVPERREKEPL